MNQSFILMTVMLQSLTDINLKLWVSFVMVLKVPPQKMFTKKVIM